MFSHSLSEDILYFILGFGILQGFLLAAFLYFHPKSDRSVNKFLALYILFIGCVMTIPISMNLIGWKNSYILQPFPMLPGVWLYFYIRSFKERITFRKIAPHFIPVIIFLFLTYLNLSAMAEQYPDAEEVPPRQAVAPNKSKTPVRLACQSSPPARTAVELPRPAACRTPEHIRNKASGTRLRCRQETSGAACPDQQPTHPSIPESCRPKGA